MAIKKRIYILLLTAILLSGTFGVALLSPVIHSENTESGSNPVDIVLVLDCSGSMGTSDYKDLNLAGAKLAVDMLPIDNARIGVIAFGRAWSNGNSPFPVYEFKTESGKIPFKEYVALVQPLTAIPEKQQSLKTEIKHNIFDACNYEAGNCTRISSALLAAEDMLKAAGSTDYCIILLSDGEDGLYTEQGTEYSTVRNRTYSSANNPPDGLPKIPLYAIELNYGRNRNNETSKGCFAMMDEGFDEGENIVVDNEDELAQAVASVYRYFFGGGIPPGEAEIGSDGFYEVKFSIPPLISEETIIITGSGLENVEIFRKKDDGSWELYTEDHANVIFTVESPAYRQIKLIRPADGLWKLVLYGKEKARIVYQMISARELSMKLEITPLNEATAEGEYPKNSKFHCSAKFVYAGRTVGSEYFYKTYPAKLHVAKPNDKDSPPLTMKGNESGYEYDITLDISGKWEIYAYLEDDSLFRGDGRIESNVYKYTVFGNAPELIPNGGIDDFELYVGCDSEPYYLKNIFRDADNDITLVSVTGTNEKGNPIIDEFVNLKADENENKYIELKTDENENKYIVFTAPYINETLNMTVEAADADEAACSLEFKMTVRDNPPEKIKDKDIEDILSDDFIGTGEAKSRELKLSEYFTDPDKSDVLSYKITSDSKDEIFDISPIEGEISPESILKITPKKTGSEKFILTVTDKAGLSTTLIFSLKDVSMAADIARKAAIPLAAVLVIIILTALVNSLKRVPGTWDVTLKIDGKTVSMPFTNKPLPEIEEFKKPKVDMQRLLSYVSGHNYEDRIKAAIPKNAIVIKGRLNSNKPAKIKINQSKIGELTLTLTESGDAHSCGKKKTIVLKDGDKLEINKVNFSATIKKNY